MTIKKKTPTKRTPGKKNENGKRKRAKRVFALVLILVLVSGGFLLVRSLLYGDGRKPRYIAVPAIPEIMLVHCHLENDTAYLSIHCILENKSPFRLNIDSVYLDLKLGGELLVSENQYIGLRLKHGEKDSTILKVQFPHKELKKRIQSLQSQDSTDIEVDAAIVYNTLIGKKSFSFTKKHHIEVPIPPELKIIGVRKEKIHLFKKELEAILFLEIQNHGKRLNIDISEFHYDLNIANELKTKGKLLKKVLIRPQHTKIVRFPGKFEIRAPFVTLGQILTDTDRLPFDLTISGYIDSKKIKHLPVLITAKGMVELRNEDKAKEQKKRIKNL